MKILAVGFWGAVLALSLSACGSKSSGGDCPNAAACGGDITGTWKITSSCLTLKADSTDQNCPDEKITGTDVKMSGTITYGTDMTYNSSVTVDVSVTLSIPSSCLTQGGITLTCAQVQQALTAQAGSDTGTTSATCSAAGSGCSCKLVSAPEVQTESGTYTTTASGTLSQKNASSSSSDDLSDFCVKGSTLTLSPHGSTMMGSPTVTGTVALAKQ